MNKKLRKIFTMKTVKSNNIKLLLAIKSFKAQ